MNTLKFLISASLIFISLNIFSQAWVGYTNGDDVQYLLADGNTLWAATTGGLAKIDLQTLESEVYTKSNSGLPYNKLSTLALDNDHNLWIGTKNPEGFSGGLIKFDGVNWTVYNSFNSGLPEEDIGSIVADQDNNMWVGTVFGGLAKFDGTNWQVWDTYPWIWVKTMTTDGSGNIWMGTQTAGLLKYDGQDWTQYNLENSGISSNRIEHMEFDNDGILWMATWGGYICQFDGSNWYTHNGCFYYRVTSLTIEDSDVIWAVPHAHGLARYDSQWTNFLIENSALPEDYLHVVEMDMDNNLWVGAWRHGLGMFQDTNWTSVNTSSSGLPCNWVRKIITDWNENNYISTYFGGVASFNGNDWQAYDSTNSIVPNINNSDIKNEGDSVLWFGTYNGLIKFDGVNWIKYDTLNSNIPGNSVSCVGVDNNGIIWMGIFELGLVKFDGNEWIVFNEANSNLPTNVLYHIEIDNNNNVWIGTPWYGLIKFDGQNSWTIYNTTNSGIPENDIRCLHIDEEGIVYVGTHYGGIGICDDTNWIVYNDNNSPITHNWVSAILQNEDDLWIGTRGGLFKLRDDEWTIYKSNNSGLPNNFILSLDLDDNNKLWIGMYEGGLAVFDESQLSGDKPELVDKTDKISIYPNPVRKGQDLYLNCLEYSQQTYSAKLFKLNGEEIISQSFIQRNKVISISTKNLAPGIYILNIISEKGQVTSFKVILL